MKADIYLRLGAGKALTVLDFGFSDSHQRWEVECGTGQLPQDLTVEQGRTIIKSFSAEGSRFFRKLDRHGNAPTRVVNKAILPKDGQVDHSGRLCLELCKGVSASRGLGNEVFIHEGPLKGTITFRGDYVEGYQAEYSKGFAPEVLFNCKAFPALHQSGLPESLEKQVPAQYRYWETDDVLEMVERLEGLRKAELFGELLVTPAGPVRTHREVKHFAWEPDPQLSLEELVKSILPEDRTIVSPIGEENWRLAIKKADADGSVVFVDYDDLGTLTDIGEELADTLCDFVVTCPKTIEHAVVLEKMNSGSLIVFRDAPDRLFAMSTRMWGRQLDREYYVDHRNRDHEITKTAFTNTVNMDLQELKDWKRTKESKKASAREMLFACQSVLEEDGTWGDDTWIRAAKTADTIGKLRLLPQSPERDAALKNCGHDPSKKEIAAEPTESDKAVVEQLTKSCKIITKEEGEERFIYGVVAEPDTVDAHGDILSRETIRNACHGFMDNYRAIHLQHKTDISGMVQIIENFIAPVAFTVNGELVHEGSWVMGVRAHDDVIWEACKSGTLTGYSWGGWASRVPVDR